MSEDLRPLMFALAYRMVASVSDAEDLVQEAYLRMQQALAAEAEIEVPKAYLTTIVARLAIDHLRSARVRRETYPGPWMPEPVVERVDEAPADSAELADSLSIAYLVLLDRLSATERAVFLLHDVFGYRFEEIAPMVDRSEAGCRQIAVRARRRLEPDLPHFDSDPRRRVEVAEQFLSAFRDGDIDALMHIVAQDAVFVGDGGGKAAALPEPIHGRDRVVHLVGAFANQNRRLNLRFEPALVNAQPGAVVRDLDGLVVTVLGFDIVDGEVHTIRSIVNPDKIGHLGAVSPLTRRREGSGE
ncbi:MAG TPA: RNA polymerase sigma factor SigJ [Solirubrobacteraceae bacterium]